MKLDFQLIRVIMYKNKAIKETKILIIDGDRGKNYPQQRDFIENGYCLFLNAKNVTQNGFSFINKTFITKEKDNSLNKGKLNRYDIVLTTRGTVGNVAYYDNTVNFDNLRINSGMVILRADGNELNPEFLYYQLQSEIVQKQIQQLKTCSVLYQLPVKLLNDINIIVPPIHAQKNIVIKIRTLVSKIKNNSDEIDLLQEIVNEQYKRIFISNKTNEKEKNDNVYSVIQETKEKNINNHKFPVLSVIKEGVFKASNDVFVKQVYSKNTEKYKIVRNNEIAYNPARANIGSIAMLKDFDIGLVNPIYTVFKLKDFVTPTYFYYYMKQPIFLEMIKHHAIGTTRQNFPIEAFKMFPIKIPPMELQLKFEEIAKPIEQKVSLLKKENEILLEMRDTLLPKLLNGELVLNTGDDNE